MSITSGFFNSVNRDRLYSAEDFARIFDGILNDGIFASVGEHFAVSPTGGRGIKVGTGRAWLNSTYTLNDADYPLELENTTAAGYKRIDAICIKVDHSDEVRANSIVVISGAQQESPIKPVLSDQPVSGIYYHALAYVTVGYDTDITTSDIENAVGFATGTPYVTGLLESTPVDELFAQWDGQFNTWWENVKATLDTDTVTRLQNEIDHLKPSESTILKYFEKVADAGANPTDAILSQISILLTLACQVYIGYGEPSASFGQDRSLYIDIS